VYNGTRDNDTPNETRGNKMKAYGLKNNKAKRSIDILDVSFICQNNKAWVVIRQCDYDDIRSVTKEKARKMYKRFLESGFVVCSPTYKKVLKDDFQFKAYKEN